jgi:CubicO group peptidase (beta-lactamase class C family)
LKAFVAGYELRRDPGAAYEYSNLGFGLLGYALAQLNHTTYRAMTEEEILKPLGMTMSSTTLTQAMRAHLAPGHRYTGEAAKNWDFDALAGAGAIRSTANDMLRYLKANMGTDQSPLAAAMKLAQQPRRDMGKTSRIGLAWMTTNKGIVWKDGWTDGYRSFLGFTADRRQGVVILANTAADVNDLGFATLDATSPLAPTYKAIVLPIASLGDYVGTYRFNSGAVVDFTLKGDHLEAQITGQPAFRIFASAKDKFFITFAYAHLEFERDAGGKVVAVVLHQNGRDIRASRVKTE